MKLGLSNLAWPGADAFDRLAALGAAGIEVAPTRIAPWDALTPATLAAYRRAAEAAGLTIPSLQSIFYGLPGAQLLGDTAAFAAMREHMRRVAVIAASLGARIAVFGAPNNRRRFALPEPDAEALAAERLHALGDIAAPAGLTIALEPVPPEYGGDTLTHAAAALRVVQAAAHPAVRLHLDTACALLAHDSIAAAIAAAGPTLAHFHAQEPGLAPFATPRAEHQAAATALRAAAYPGWIILEMREQPNPWPAIEQALQYARPTYA